jgi:LmbE family N-acetylglucosaminyl deacetylase
MSGRAPEQANHPDHVLAQQLAKGFWASLPLLSPQQIQALLARGQDTSGQIDTSQIDEAQLRIALGRIACGYDGGQIIG